MFDSSKESQKTGLHDGNIGMSELEHLKDGWHHSCFEQFTHTSWLGGRIFPSNPIHVRVCLGVLWCARLFCDFSRIFRTLPVCLKPMFYSALQIQNGLGRLIGAQQRVQAGTLRHSSTWAQTLCTFDLSGIQHIFLHYSRFMLYFSDLLWALQVRIDQSYLIELLSGVCRSWALKCSPGTNCVLDGLIQNTQSVLNSTEAK